MYRRLPQAEESTHRIFSAQCRQVTRSLAVKVRFSEIVRYNLLEDLARYSYLENIAQTLSCHPEPFSGNWPRSKTSFTVLVEDVRLNLSLEYLTGTHLPVGRLPNGLATEIRPASAMHLRVGSISRPATIAARFTH